jgi:hypothetical protein
LEYKEYIDPRVIGLLIRMEILGYINRYQTRNILNEIEKEFSLHKEKINAAST